MTSLQQPPFWRQILKTNFTHWQKFAKYLELSDEQMAQIEPAPQFVLNVPLRIASKIKKGTLNDPLLRQFLPTREESILTPHFEPDPINDHSFCRTPKLLQKYAGRALLLCTSACAMHCRYCFRQNFPYDTRKNFFENELKEITNDDSLQEVILSGGDPLSLSDENLRYLLEKLSAISHIRRIRFHSRFPIGIPERIDSNFLKLLTFCPKQIWFVIHSNHPAEFDEEIWRSLNRLQRLGIPILNQSVLLKGVNDDVETLSALCQMLVDHGISPYYLHQLDRVQGAAHFEVPEEKGGELITQIRQRLSGYAVPLYVREIPGEFSKTPFKLT